MICIKDGNTISCTLFSLSLLGYRCCYFVFKLALLLWFLTFLLESEHVDLVPRPQRKNLHRKMRERFRLDLFLPRDENRCARARMDWPGWRVPRLLLRIDRNLLFRCHHLEF